jgi:hypothetical protein
MGKGIEVFNRGWINSDFLNAPLIKGRLNYVIRKSEGGECEFRKCITRWCNTVSLNGIAKCV